MGTVEHMAESGWIDSSSNHTEAESTSLNNQYQTPFSTWSEESKLTDTHHATVVCVKEVNDFLGITVPQVNIATVTASDNKLTARTIEIHSFHCKHMTTAAHLFLN